jgi:hypothetical protein
MIIKQNGKLIVVAGREEFVSTFRSGNRRTRNRAHKNFIKALEERGYYGNGVRRKSFELPSLPSPDDTFDIDPTMMWGQMSTLMAEFTSQVEALSTDRGELKFYENPDTGQRIPLEILMAATNLWPVEEVLELLPQ